MISRSTFSTPMIRPARPVTDIEPVHIFEPICVSVHSPKECPHRGGLRSCSGLHTGNSECPLRPKAAPKLDSNTHITNVCFREADVELRDCNTLLVLWTGARSIYPPFLVLRGPAAERAGFGSRLGTPFKLPVIPFSCIHLTWASYFSARDWDSSAGLTLVGAEASTRLSLVFLSRRKNIGLLFLLGRTYRFPMIPNPLDVRSPAFGELLFNRKPGP